MVKFVPCIYRSDEWLDLRRSGIGGSDAGAAVGVDPYRTPYELFVEKVDGPDPDPDMNNAMYWGNVFEPVLRQEYVKMTSEGLMPPRDTEGIYIDEKYPFMLATLDDMTVSGRLVEYKTSRYGKGWGKEETQSIPPHYMVQVQHYMSVMGCDVTDVAVLIGGQDFRIYEITANRALQSAIIEAESEFWDCVEKDDPPDPVSVTEAIRKFKMSEPTQVVADYTMEVAYRALHKTRDDIKEMQSHEDALKLTIMNYMGSNEVLVDLVGKEMVTWKKSKGRERVALDLLRRDHSELVAQYTTLSEPSRRFVIKTDDE
jgi:putative phage-type endonuclease